MLSTLWNLGIWPWTLGNRLVSYGSSERKPLLVFAVVVIFLLMLLFCDTRMKKPRTSQLLIFFLSHLHVPVRLSRYLYHLQYPVILYFLVAFVFNIAEVVQLSLYGDPLSSSLTPQANQSFPSLISSAGANSSLASSHNRQWRIHDTSMTNATLY